MLRRALPVRGGPSPLGYRAVGEQIGHRLRMVVGMDVVVMPQLGETVVEGTITAWSKAVGDQVAVDETLFEVSTEKVDTEVPSAVGGFVRALLVDEGDAVPIGTPLVIITATADEPFDLPATSPGPSEPSSHVASGDGASRNAATSGRSASVDAVRTAAPDARAGTATNGSSSAPRQGGPVRSPVVHRLLAEHRLDPAEVVGSGSDGRITRNDVLAAAAQRSRPDGARGATPRDGTDRDGTAAGRSTGQPALALAPLIEVGPDDEVVPLSRARLATAEHLHRSTVTAAHALVVVEVDWSAVEAVRRRAGLSYLPFAARAVIDALRSFPHLNASFDTDRLVVHRRIDLGFAVDVQHEVLLVPVIHAAHTLRLRPLADAISELADLARRRRLPGDAFDGGTFTVTNVGSYGTVLAAPIINPGQVAILSTDGVRMRPVAVPDTSVDGAGETTWATAIHPVGNLSLSFDHRAVDGAYAAAFLAEVRSILEDRDWSIEVAP